MKLLCAYLFHGFPSTLKQSVPHSSLTLLFVYYLTALPVAVAEQGKQFIIMKRSIFIFATLFSVAVYSQTYIDLGLPSGTQWKTENEMGLYSYEEAVVKFGKNLPTKEQFEELINSCQWSWNKGYCKVTGPNGEYIILPAEGRFYKSRVRESGSRGIYWSSTPRGPEIAWNLYFWQYGQDMGNGYHFLGLSVRLVR